MSLSSSVVELEGTKYLLFCKYNALEWGWQMVIPTSTPEEDKDTRPLGFFI